MHGKRDGLALLRRRDDIQHRQVMIRRGHRENCFAAEAFIFEQWGVNSGDEHLFYFIFKADGPVVWVGNVAAPSVGMQIVDEISAADDEHAFVTKRGETLPDLVVK